MGLRDPLLRQNEPEPENPKQAAERLAREQAAGQAARTRASAPKRRGARPTQVPEEYRIGSKGEPRQPGWSADTRYDHSFWPIDTPKQRQALLERISADRAAGVIDVAAAYAERLHFAARCMEAGL